VRIDSGYGVANACGRTVIGGSNGNIRASGDFGGVLQERVSKLAGSESVANGSAAVKFDLTNKVLDRSEVEAGGEYGGFFDDPELKAYGRQLALESGIAFKNEDEPGKVKERQEVFLYQLRQLLDRGLISRQDIIDSVEFPPKAFKTEDGSCGYRLDMNGLGKKMKEIELASDLNLLKAIRR